MSGYGSAGSQSFRPASDYQNKARALWRLRRAASSGLPLHIFIRVVFDLIHDAIPYSPNKAIMPFGDPALEAYIFNTDVMEKWREPYKHYIIDAPAIVSGRRISVSELAGSAKARPVWSHEQTMLPVFHRSAGYNECFRYLGYHHVIAGMLTEGGEWRGWIPLWRSEDMKPFTRDDAAFIEAAVPHITHGIAVARGLEALDANQAFLAGDGAVGVVLMRPGGTVVAMDEIARSIFHHLAIYERGSILFDGHDLRCGFEYVSLALRAIFAVQDKSPWQAPPPTTAVHFHRSGIALRLRATMTETCERERFITVLLERGETRAGRRMRLLSRYGLSAREFELLEMVNRGLNRRDAAARMGITIDTLKSYLYRLSDKFALDGSVASLRDFARNLRL